MSDNGAGIVSCKSVNVAAMSQSTERAASLVDAMAPLAGALASHLRDGNPVEVEFRRDDGLWYRQSTMEFFDVPEWVQDIEKIALDLAEEPILDAGAGIGRHTLELQQRGLEVTAVDVHPAFVEMMRDQGVADARVMDVRELKTGGWRTVYFLMETIGLAETLDGLGELLTHLKKLVAEDGQIILDSEAVVVDDNAQDTRDGSQYEGEVSMQMRFDDLTGPAFRWLYIDAETLKDVAAANGWHAHIAVIEPETGHYLARLSHLPR